MRLSPTSGRNRLVWSAGFLALICIVAAGGRDAKAQALQIAPVVIILAPGQQTSTLSLSNTGSSPQAIQVRCFAWSQLHGIDTLGPTDNLLASPPLATLPTGRTQTVRLVLRHPATTTEQTFRVLVDQIPPAGQPGVVQVSLRLSLPVFAAPLVPVHPTLKLGLEAGPEGAALVARNEGTMRAKLIDVRIQDARSHEITLIGPESGWILPGAERRWQVPHGTTVSPGASLNVTAQSEKGPISDRLRVVEAP